MSVLAAFDVMYYLRLLGDPLLVLLVAGGVLLIILLLVLLILFRKRREKKAARAIGAKASAGGNTAIAKSAQIAKLEGLRREFDGAVKKFRDAGRSLYSTPWYVFVGESGSGKTEAIRHAKLREIPGLQDPLQGVGGTINMNWWFTRDAVLLDTAGRMMFEEVSPGSTSEWTEFLRLLKETRGNCPINGLFLVISAESLVSSTTERIQERAGKIAAQFENLQLTLGVRFPVFVLISKCDLIGGFNEFFESIDDPAQQAQLLGWSNPKPLDAEFDPREVEQHLEGVRKRLLKRRMRLLNQPMHAETRRVDELDALWNLPDNLVRLAPRLRTYLETIFVSGAWSQKPLFLRGIYFTSAMQKGSPLDLELSFATGIPIDQLPRGQEMDKKKSYFLRDVFLEKAFVEKGLVTRVSNVDAAQRKRRVMVYTTAILAVAVLIGLTAYSANELQAGLLGHAQAYRRATPVAEALAGRAIPEKVTGDGLTRFDLLRDSSTFSQRPIQIPMMFRGTATFDSLESERREIHRQVVEQTLLKPLMAKVRRNLASGDVKWTTASRGAFAQLLEFEDREVESAVPLPNIVGVLARGGLGGEDLKAYETNVAIIEEAINLAYPKPADRNAFLALVQPADRDTYLANEAMLENTRRNFMAYYARDYGRSATTEFTEVSEFPLFAELTALAKRGSVTEANIRSFESRLKDASPMSVQEWRDVKAGLVELLTQAKLSGAERSGIDAIRLQGYTGGSVREWFKAEVKAKHVARIVAEIREAIPKQGIGSERTKVLRKFEVDIAAALESRGSALEASLAKADLLLVMTPADSQSTTRPSVDRFEAIIKALDDLSVDTTDATNPAFNYLDLKAEIVSATDAAKATFAAPAVGTWSEGLTRFAVPRAVQRAYGQWIGRFAKWEDVAAVVKGGSERVAYPRVPLVVRLATEKDYDGRFWGPTYKKWKAGLDLVNATAAATATTDPLVPQLAARFVKDAVRNVATPKREYERQYGDYWQALRILVPDVRIEGGEAQWNELRDARVINAEIVRLAKQIRESMAEIDPSDPQGLQGKIELYEKAGAAWDSVAARVRLRWRPVYDGLASGDVRQVKDAMRTAGSQAFDANAYMGDDRGSAPLDMVRHYWNALAVVALEKTVTERKRLADRKNFIGYFKFPLDSAGTKSMTVDELEAAREDLQSLLGELSEGIVPVTRPAGASREWMLDLDDRLKTVLDEVGKPPFQGDMDKWARRGRQVLRQIPLKGKTIAVTVTFTPGGDNRSALRYLRISSGGSSDTALLTGMSKELRNLKLTIPGDDIVIEYLMNDGAGGDQRDVKLTIPGPWAGLMFVADGNYSATYSDKTKKYSIRVYVNGRGDGDFEKLDLEFKDVAEPFPRSTEWPVSPKQQR